MKKYAALALVTLALAGCSSAAVQTVLHQDAAIEICEAIEHGANFDELIGEYGQPVFDHAALEVCSFS